MLGYRTPSFGAARAPKAPRAAAPPRQRVSPFGTQDTAFPSLNTSSSYSPADVAASLAANPQASKGGYEGVGTTAHPGPMGQTTYHQPTPTPTAGPVNYSYDTDPVLQQILGFSTSGRANAEADAVSAKKKLAVDFNDADLATALGDPSTADAARGNQFGVLEALKHNYEQGASQLDEQLNDQGNLFYSGYRGVQQGNLARDYQGQQQNAAGQEQDILGQITSGLRDALLGYDQNDAQARRDASGNAIDNAVNSGFDPGAGAGTDPYAAPYAGQSADPGAGGAGDFRPDPGDIASLIFPTANTPLIDPSALQDSLIAALLAPNQRKLLNPLLG